MSQIEALSGRVVEFARDRRRRRIAYAVAAVVALVLSLFPRPYLARVMILPQESNSGASALITALGGGVQNFATVLGAQKTNYLVIGRSHVVQRDVIARLKLIGRKGFRGLDQAELKLARKVDIQILTGGVLQITAKDTDPKFAKELVTGFTAAIQERLANLGHEQTAHKKQIIASLLAEGVDRLAKAEDAMTRYRAANDLAAPEAEFNTRVGAKLGADAALQAKFIELQTARRFATDETIRIKTIKSEIAALQQRIVALSDASDPRNLKTLSVKNLEYLRLYRDVRFAADIVEVYRRFLEEVGVEELSAGTNVQILENPYVDPERQYNLPAVGLLLLIALLAFYTEYYMPLTRLESPTTRLTRDGSVSANAPAS